MSELSVAIVGGGLVGALEACLLAERGFKVTLFESRHDGRNEPSYYGRSINLAISHRGISALSRLNLDYVVQERAIPMKARMIHNRDGKLIPIPYDPDGRCINSIERAGLNNFLLNKAEQLYNVKILFNHKLLDMNAETGELIFRIRDYRDQANHQAEVDNSEQPTSGEQLFRYKFDLILGCDGARSTVRSLLSRQTQLEVSQTFIEHGYLELRIDPDENEAFRMAPNYLHIWPRGKYMMIALPNKDASFTCTLFMPFDILQKIKDPEAGLKFFQENFPDSIELIGEQRIKSTLSTIGASSLISIKCRPYHFKDKVALLGDSAHAMVPFYGQGMNCGFEDCLVLDEMLDKYVGRSVGSSSSSSSSNGLNKLSGQELREQIGKALAEYGEIRCANGYSMCDLAMYNYIEMRDLVNTWSFMMRKHLDNLLYRLFPSKWIPLYTMVTFSRIPVNECVKRREQQDLILTKCLNIGSIVLGLSLTGGLLLTRGRHLLTKAW